MKYQLGRNSKLDIKVSFPRQILEADGQLQPANPMVKSLQEKLQLSEFIEFGKKHSGYGGNLTLIHSSDILVYEASLPERFIETCPGCNGEGKRSYADIIEPCSYCDGSGEAFTSNYKIANGICASLSMLFYWLNYHEEDSPMRISTLISRGMNGASMSAELSPDILAWLAKISEGARYQFGYVNTAMIKAYQWMSRYNKWDIGKIGAIAIDGRLSIDCPGDRSGLFRSSMENELFPHNLDTSIQQLTLLIGLAQLQDEFRRS